MISVMEKLPAESKSYLGYCIVQKAYSDWKGFIEVYFDPQTGWHRCENDVNENSLRVIYYMELPEKPK